MPELHRRAFVKTASMAVAAGPLSRSVLGANDRIVVGMIGVGGMGRSNLGAVMRSPGVAVAAVCDVNQVNLQRALEMAGGAAESYGDFRKLLERKDIDAVMVSTPDHWHALPTIYACQAGKDVYVEKPLALTIDEQQRMVKAAREHQRVVQMGTQQRSGRHFQRAVELVRSGAIGGITSVRTWNYENRAPQGIGYPPDGDPPATLDWDMWLGPAPRVPFNLNRASGSFRWFWDYSGGKLTDWGTHLIDIVQWAMDVDGPVSATAMGGKFRLKDNRETPDTMEVNYQYPNFVLTYSYRECNARGIHGRDYGIEFYGTEGSLLVDRGGFEVIPEYRRVEGNEMVARVPASRSGSSDQHGAHVRNWLECIRSRELPISDVRAGHTTTTTSHLGNIAFRTRQKVEWDPVEEKLVNPTPEAAALVSREYRAPWRLP
jgi:predicted dehydrogenase